MDNYIGQRHITAVVSCPYCNTEQKRDFFINTRSDGCIHLGNPSVVVRCETDYAGCGKDFVCDNTLKLTTTTRKIR